MSPTLRAIACRAALLLAAVLAPPLHTGDPSTWRHAAAQAQAPAAKAPSTAEKDAFDAAKELGTVEAWDAFLSNYPSGFHADLARAYVKKLAGPASTPAPSAPAPAATPPPAAPAAQSSALLPPAEERPCRDARNIRSENSNQPAKLRFVNESDAAIVIQWIDFNGSLKEYAVLQPGAELTQDTFLTHPWIAAYMEGSCRQLFLPGAGVTIARLRPESQLRGESASPASPRPKVSSGKRRRDDDERDHGPTPEQTCRNIGQDYVNGVCVKRKSAKPPKPEKPSKATIERRAAAACFGMGMLYINGQCAPKKKSERIRGEQNKNVPCPKGMYRNPYGKCQPNETGG
jgi:hypothetical protein